MKTPRRDTITIRASRGQSTLLGMVLLIGMVAVGSLGLLLVATDAMAGIEQQSENDRTEQAFVELSQQLTSASSTTDVSRSIDVDVGEKGAVAMTNTGELQIEGGDVNKTIPIGAIEYTGDDRSKTAYQAGGIFRETGNETQVVSAPPIEYDAESETLSFPIVKTRDEHNINSGEFSIAHYETDPLQDASLVENDTVTITIESDYYRGWEAYFEQQGGATTIQSVEQIDDNSGKITAEFGFQEVSDAFKTGAIYATDISGNYQMDEEMTKKKAYPELDSEVETYVNETSSNTDVIDLGTVTDHKTLDDGIYIADEIEGSGDLEFDLTHGNATLVVDGNLTVDGSSITVTEYEEGNDLSIYLTGDYDARNGGDVCVADEYSCAENEDGTVIQLVATSESQVEIGPGGNSRFEGVIYAGGTESEWDSCGSQICIHSNPNLYGSVVASSVYVQGGAGSIDFEYDPKLENADLSIYPDPDALPPQLTYLNVAEYQIDISEN
ncbi:hypothetical protein G6M89_10550 [Natronolimnobius sp. AArcel1]|uniref:DUF7289 family protein n=1 Tax=Natronolimnobius sp. AArcel1 TaxID=1679093 RepID=UPI0013EB3221|nr:hypothetical protein [Natronolimnobius sp. AArcel1]NGM69439.1 hypothetical protein [Natronolimnobius sp. AArcel1]